MACGCGHSSGSGGGRKKKKKKKGCAHHTWSQSKKSRITK